VEEILRIYGFNNIANWLIMRKQIFWLSFLSEDHTKFKKSIEQCLPRMDFMKPLLTPWLTLLIKTNQDWEWSCWDFEQTQWRTRNAPDKPCCSAGLEVCATNINRKQREDWSCSSFGKVYGMSSNNEGSKKYFEEERLACCISPEIWKQKIGWIKTKSVSFLGSRTVGETKY